MAQANFKGTKCTKIDKNYDWFCYEQLPKQLQGVIQEHNLSSIELLEMYKAKCKQLTKVVGKPIDKIIKFQAAQNLMVAINEYMTKLDKDGS